QMTGTPGAIQGPRQAPVAAAPASSSKVVPLTPTLSPGGEGATERTAAACESSLPAGERVRVRGLEANTDASNSAPLDPPPLAGVRILEITNLIAGPTAGRILADLGADMIKLEPPTGDLSRPIGRTYFYAINFNKRSIAVDTSTDNGRTVV